MLLKKIFFVLVVVVWLPATEDCKAQETVSPKYVLKHRWQVVTYEKQRKIVLVESTLPGTATVNSHNVRLKVCATNGKICTSTEFSLGWNEPLVHACVRDISHFPFSIIELTTYTVWTPENKKQLYPVLVRSQQYYAILNDKPVLIRLFVNREKSLLRNMYYGPNIRIGPPVPVRTEQQWENALLSSNPIEILRTLTWLAGHQETDAAKSLVAKVLNRPRVHSAIKLLAKSTHPWFKDAAILVSK